MTKPVDERVFSEKLAALAHEAKTLHKQNEAMRKAIADAVNVARNDKLRAAHRLGVMCRILVEAGFRR